MKSDAESVIRKDAYMKLIAAFDIGTTAVKGTLVSIKGEVIGCKSINIDTIFAGEYKEQRPVDWYEAFCSISKEFFAEYCTPDDILGIIMSGQMQDTILVDKDFNVLFNAILYSDNRADKQAQSIIEVVGKKRLTELTSNNFDGSIPLAKLIWIKDNHPEIYKKIHKVLISAKDYCVGRLSGEFITDVTSAATSGIMNIKTKGWGKEIFDALEIEESIFPRIKYSHEQAGVVTENASKESMYNAGTPVYVGTGDAGATTLASGLSSVGEFNINLGTSGWVACLSENPIRREGVFNLAGMPTDTFIAVVPFLNAGNVHKWVSTIVTSESVENRYEEVSKLLDKSVCGSNGLMFLPYLAGERFPVMDSDTKGCYIGITPETSKSDMVRSCLEGVAFSIRQGIDLLEIAPRKMTLIGGGAKSSVWCQIMADMLNIEIELHGDSEYLPAIAITASILLDMGYISSYSEFIESIQEKQTLKKYLPNQVNVEKYNSMYFKYKQIYEHVKPLFK